MRPIDLLDNFSKAPLAGREQAVQQASSELGQRHAARALDQEHALDQTRVKQGEESEAAENRVDREGDRRQGGSRRQRGEAGDESADDDSGGGRTRPRPAGYSREIDITA